LLVATDVAARGIDVNDLSHVINYNLPDQNESYTHRSGRTGRAQKNGVCISIVTPAESRTIRRLEDMVGKKIEYKKVPEGKEVCKKQIDSFLEELENTNIEDAGNDEYFADVIEKLKKHTKEDLIKFFVVNKFNRLMNDYKKAPDLNATAKTRAKTGASKISDADAASLKINFGRKQGMDVKGVFALINSARQLKGVEVGKISLMNDFSIFTVDKKRADEVLNSLQGKKFRGKQVAISKTTMKPSFQGGRRGPSKKRGGGFNRGSGNKNFKNKRRNFRKPR
jgi:ATP-dependent RNA helicase DeaD